MVEAESPTASPRLRGGRLLPSNATKVSSKSPVEMPLR